MKQLLILRHGKAEPSHPEGDYFRHLTEEGRQDVDRVAELAQLQGLRPDVFLASAAARTTETARHFAARYGLADRVDTVPTLYNATPGQLLSAIYTVDDVHSTLVVVGHNPGVSELVALLAPPQQVVAELPTSGLAVLHWKTGHWAGIRPRSADGVEVILPAHIAG